MRTSEVCVMVGVFVMVVVIALALLGCAPARLTAETRWPGEPDLIVVEWPDDATELSEIEVHEVDGRLQIVGPYRPGVVTDGQ